MPGNRPTIRDVAREAGVSVTTVSDAVNGKGRVDPDTRVRVERAAATVGWRPTRSARALRSGRTGIVALCLPDRPSTSSAWLTSADYNMELAAACAAEALDRGRYLLLAPAPTDKEAVERLEVDGAIVVDPVENDPTLAALAAGGVPAVTVDRDIGGSDDWSVQADNRGGTIELLEHLRTRGATTIAMLSAPHRWSWFHDAEEAYRWWCERHDQPPRLAFADPYDSATASRDALASLLRSPRPDAIVALPYGTAVEAIRVADEAGLVVPADLLVASGVDGHLLTASSPTITALDLRPTDVGRAAVDRLSRRLEGSTEAAPVVLDARLRLREST